MSTPFGGYKQSGFGGRDNSIHAHDQYTELKTIWIDLSDRAPEESIDQTGVNHPFQKRLYFYDPEGRDWEFFQYHSDDVNKRNDYKLPDRYVF